MSRPKEAGYHALDLNMTEAITDHDEYLALFDAGGDCKLRGDATPWYLFSTKAATSIHAMSPDAKIVVHLRHPVEVLASLHNHHVFVGIESETDFRTAVLGAPRTAESADFRDGLDYLAVARFGEQIARYLDLFPKEQISFVKFADLKRDSKRVHRDLLAQLGVEPVELGEQKRLNPGRRRRSPAVQRALGVVEKTAAKNRWTRAVHSRLDHLNTVKGRETPDAGLQREILDVLDPDIKQLEGMLDIDLSSWKTPYGV